jgi:hypothetical protein
MSDWRIEPTKTRYVRVIHQSTGCEWAFQFPESVVATEGQLLDYPAFDVPWEKKGEGWWGYMFHADEAHVEELREATKGEEHMACKTFLAGLEIRADIECRDHALKLTLVLSNRTGRALHGVVCDGGCFQARATCFAGARERERTWAMVGGAPTSLSRLEHGVAERCCVHTDKSEGKREPWRSGTWFWGESKGVVDPPAVVAMEAHVEGLAVGIGYEQARTILANADSEHHCLHSCPTFGDMAIGETVMRRGWIVAGENAGDVLEKLRMKVGG